MQKKYVMIHDERRCTGCQACGVACRSENQVPLQAFRLQVRIEGPYGAIPHLHYRYHRVSRQQCEHAPCVSVCPTAA